MAKKTLDKCRKGKDFISYAASQGAKIKNGKGSHIKVYGPRGMCPVPNHNKDLGNGLRCAIIKMFVAIGLGILVLACFVLQNGDALAMAAGW